MESESLIFTGLEIPRDYKTEKGEIDIVLADELDTSVSTLHDESVSESASDDLNFKNKEKIHEIYKSDERKY